MAKNQRRKSKSPKKVEKLVEKEDVQMSSIDADADTTENEEETGKKLTLATLDAISDEEGEGDEGAEWNAEARALRQAIAEGAFDKIGKTEALETKVEEITLAEDDSSAKNEEEETEEEETLDEEALMKKARNEKALETVTMELTNSMAKLPWAERYDVTPSTSLPFGKKNEEGIYVDVHDDLKREVAFYNLALEAVHAGREECEKIKIPFSRPEDFFAEMVKTDDHMAQVKDRLIFESKKMESFEQRKSNKEQLLRAKEAHSHRLSEKAKSKKRHMQDVDDWAKSAASNRAGNNVVHDDDSGYLDRMNEGPNKRRQAMDRKYGHGGKTGRFKQNSKKSMNDMSGFNPKGNFTGGQKGAGSKRQGKRARDSAKARR